MEKSLIYIYDTSPVKCFCSIIIALILFYIRLHLWPTTITAKHLDSSIINLKKIKTQTMSLFSICQQYRFPTQIVSRSLEQAGEVRVWVTRPCTHLLPAQVCEFHIIDAFATLTLKCNIGTVNFGRIWNQRARDNIWIWKQYMSELSQGTFSE